YYSYRNRSRSWELAENLIGSTGRHVWKLGAGALLRGLDGYLTAGRDGQYQFHSLNDFAKDHPTSVYVGVSRPTPASDVSGGAKIPDYNRQYRYNQFFAYGQDNFRLTPRLVLNVGVRYENFGVPSNTGQVKDQLLDVGVLNLGQTLK